ncbi:hypothetical protein AB0D67_38190 [Streptosporangium sp. NPDC048047]|uniref:hypothetical protein n=1 Tax=Streptosporangium sp. NPDC048047 TaxID=3155748 RepID=UPI00342C095A
MPSRSDVAAKKRRPKPWLDRNLLLSSTIAAFAGLFGAIVGFGGSYLTTQNQFAHDARSKAREERITACTATLTGFSRVLRTLDDMSRSIALPFDALSKIDAKLVTLNRERFSEGAKKVDQLENQYQDTIPALYITGSDDAIATVDQFTKGMNNVLAAITGLIEAQANGVGIAEANEKVGEAIKDINKTQGRMAAICRADADIKD